MTDDTYEPPAHGWTCFHCGETFPATFAGQRDARAHFGPQPSDEPACVMRLGPEERALLPRLRRLEAELERYRGEDSDKDRELAAMRTAHAAALRGEEEKGYERGLRDGRTSWEITPAMLRAAWFTVRKWWPPGTMVLVDAPQPGLKEAIEAALNAARAEP